MMSQIDFRKIRAVALTALLATGVTAALLQHAPSSAQGSPVVRGLPDFTELVEQVGPSVVNIRTVERVRAGAGPTGNGLDEEMQEFFRRFFGQPLPGAPRQPQRPNRPQQEEERPRGVGSGFILTQTALS
jgi:serine protease Do